MTIEMFLESGIENFSKVYYGKNTGCRCGCRGEYISTTYCSDQRQDVNDKLFISRLNRAKKIINSKKYKDIEIYSNCINIAYLEDVALCFYFDDLKG